MPGKLKPLDIEREIRPENTLTATASTSSSRVRHRRTGAIGIGRTESRAGSVKDVSLKDARYLGLARKRDMVAHPQRTGRDDRHVDAEISVPATLQGVRKGERVFAISRYVAPLDRFDLVEVFG
jgi:hypothetical protein